MAAITCLKTYSIDLGALVFFGAKFFGGKTFLEQFFFFLTVYNFFFGTVYNEQLNMNAHILTTN